MDIHTLPPGHHSIDDAPSPAPEPIAPAHVASPSTDYRERARAAGIELDYEKRHRFRDTWKPLIFGDFEHARATVKGTRKALVVVDAAIRGAISLDREAIETVFPDLVEAYDHLVGMKKERDQGFDPDKDLVVLFAGDPKPEYHGLRVDGFLVWRVAGTAHFRQYPVPADPRAERRAFGSQGE